MECSLTLSHPIIVAHIGLTPIFVIPTSSALRHGFRSQPGDLLPLYFGIFLAT